MKITTTQTDLVRALAHVKMVAERKSFAPVLCNVLVKSDGSTFTLTATDMDRLLVVEDLPNDAGRDGQCTVNAHTLYDLVRKMPKGCAVMLEYSDERLTVNQAKMATLPVEDFPIMESRDMPHRFTLQASVVQTLIDRTRFAVSTEETRYYLNGIYLHVPGVLRAVATDGHRLARADAPLPKGAGQMPGVIIPRQTCDALRKLVYKRDCEVQVAVAKDRVQFTVGSVVLTSKVIDGTFPEYERVIPKGNDKVLRLDAQEFADAVDRVSAISQDRGKAVRVSLTHDAVELSCRDPENGTVSERLDSGRVEYRSAPLETDFRPGI